MENHYFANKERRNMENGLAAEAKMYLSILNYQISLPPHYYWIYRQEFCSIMFYYLEKFYHFRNCYFLPFLYFPQFLDNLISSSFNLL